MNRKDTQLLTEAYLKVVSENTILGNKITLKVEDGKLYAPIETVHKSLKNYFSGDPILLYHYDSGDVDTINWPKYDEERLRGALYGARETGVIPNVPSVLLPDGTEFPID